MHEKTLDRPTIFRPTVGSIVSQEGPLAALGVGGVVLLHWLEHPAWVVLAVVVGVGELVILWRRVIPTWRSWIGLDGDRISGRISGREFSLVLSDVVMARLESHEEGAVLHLATAGDSISVLLTGFDESRLWRGLQTRLPPDALRREAHQELPQYTEWKARSEERLLTTFEVRDALWVRLACWGGVALFLAASVFSVLAGVPWTLLIFGPLALLSLLGGVQSGITVIGPEGVTRRNLLGRYYLSWGAVRRVEISPQGDGLTLIAGERRLAVPGPIYWPSAQREALSETLSAHCEQKRINVEQSWRAAFRWSRGTKVSGPR